MGTRQLRMIEDGRAGISPGFIVLFRPAPSLDFPLFDLESYVYVLALAVQNDMDVVGEEPFKRIPVDDMHLTNPQGVPIGSAPDMWAEIWRTADREP